MTDKEYLNLALAQMHSGQWFGFKKDFTGTERMSYENIEVLDSSITKPTKAEVDAKIQDIKDAEVAKEIKKEEAKAKLIELGLTEEHLKALGI